MITVKDIEKLAELARIKLDEASKEALVKEIDAILGYVGEIQKAGVTGERGEYVPVLRNILREDLNPHEPQMFTEAILNNAPKREGNYLKVKKIIEQD